LAKYPLQQEQALVAGAKQSRQTTRLASQSFNVPALNANIVVVDTNSTHKTKQGRLALPLSCPPTLDIYAFGFAKSCT
jgi:hypothetical protein